MHGAHEIRLGDVFSNEKMAKFYNTERQGLEAAKISQVIKEHQFKTYIESKEHVKSKQILKIVDKVHGRAMQTKL